MPLCVPLPPVCRVCAVEHVPLGTKLRRGVEIPFSEQDAAGAEFETDSDEPEHESPEAAEQQQQGKTATSQSAAAKQRRQQQQAEQ